MIIKSVKMRNFMRHLSTDAVFPENGVVLLSGDNGSGKTSIISAIAYCLWGESLSKGRWQPWRGDADGSVEVVVNLSGDDLKVKRLRKRGKVSLEIGDNSVKYETTTKAQEALLALIGSYDLWRRTRVFTIRNFIGFTDATDSERKRFLENMIGLDRFDQALELCKKEIKSAESSQMLARSNLLDVQRKMSLAEERLNGHKIRKVEAKNGLDSLGDVKVVSDQENAAAVLTQKISVIKAELHRIQQEAIRLERSGGAYDGELAALQRQLNVLSQSMCSVCKQPIDAVLRDRVKTDMQTVREKTNADKQQIALSVQALRLESEKVSLGVGKLEQDLSVLRTAIAAAKSSELQRQRWQLMLNGALSDEIRDTEFLIKMEERLADAQDAEEAATLKLLQLGVVEQVLGMRGVRATILGGTLSSIEKCANTWLDKFGYAGLRVKLTSEVEQSSGKVADKIGLDVEGVGHEYGAPGLSGGEAVRVDLALLMALAEVAYMRRGGGDGGLVVLDELLDSSLSESGRYAVLDAVLDMARDKCCLLITHNKDLIEYLHGRCAHWHVENGRVSVLAAQRAQQESNPPPPRSSLSVLYR